MSNYCTAKKQLEESLALIPSRTHKKQLFVEAMLCLNACDLPQSLVGDYMDIRSETIASIPHDDMARIFERCVFMLESALDEFEAEPKTPWPEWIAAVSIEAIMKYENSFDLLEVGEPFPINKEGEF